MTPTDRKNAAPDDDASLRAAYRSASREQPSARLDAAILAAARDNVAGSAYRRTRRWAVPLSAAATLVLAVALVIFMRQEGVPPVAELPVVMQDEAPKPAMPARSAGQAMEPNRIPRAPASPEEKRREAPAAFAPVPAPNVATRLREEAAADAAAPASVSGERRMLSKSAVSLPPRADVVGVRAVPMDGGYRFRVSVRSDDRDCGQYADWWEVVGADGALLYRRILEHSHADEQPFEREGGPVAVAAETRVWVRAHLHPSGYAGTAFFGSVAEGFRAADPGGALPGGLATQPPLPAGCAR